MQQSVTMTVYLNAGLLIAIAKRQAFGAFYKRSLHFKKYNGRTQQKFAPQRSLSSFVYQFFMSRGLYFQYLWPLEL